MKISKYTFIFDIDNMEYYIYSTLSNALIEIDKISFTTLLNAKNSKSDICSTDIDSELYEILVSKKMIIDNDLDNLLYYKSIISTQRAGKSHMHLTIAPTMDCCFNCHYCFEKHKTKSYMTENIMDQIIKYLNSLESKPEIKLTWFGGEPLMALLQMEQFYNKLCTGYKTPQSSNIITTGFHLNDNAIRVMKDLNIQQIQITLDGLRETHNSVKRTPNCTNVFDQVLDNAEALLTSSNIHVVFRVNLTKQNQHEYVELYHYLAERFREIKHKGISPAFVMDKSCSNKTTSDKSIFFTSNEIAKFNLDLHNKHHIHSPYLRYPSRFFYECAIRNGMSISFDPNGYAYKCWEVIGDKDYAIGKINHDGKLEDINEIILNRQLYGADPIDDPTCSSCKYLPICNGGCPIQRIGNKFEGKKNCYCTFWKGNLEELLKVHLKLKKAGINNNTD